MSEIEKMKRYIERTKMEREPGSMSLKEGWALAEEAEAMPLESILLAFNYGCAKGYRAAKAEVRA